MPYRERDLVYTRYGLPRGHYVDGHYVGVRKAYVIDHLIPLELGGANAVTNLWPEPRSEARRKDRVEAKLHAAVCGHRLALRIAQRRIAADWRTALAGQVAK